MQKKFDHREIEKKWQKKWRESNLYRTDDSSEKEKVYILDMFPYPSGDGLHVGHPKGYIATDIYSRFKKMSGYEILHPMGWDAFGLPAENFAIKNKIHPREAVEKNIQNFKSQLEHLGFNYDWSREINTTDPTYYKWTQWIFLKLLEKGLAYESTEPINWCPDCQTGLANEDLESDDTCERCGAKVEKRPMRQWVLKITAYADRMLEDLEMLTEWPEHIKEAQRNWIGKHTGAKISFQLSSGDTLEVFTTRPDTLFGATYMVLAPEHTLVEALKNKITNWSEVEQYITEAKQKSEQDRITEGREKTGVKLEGITATNPVNNEEVPVFIADYVLSSYGTGAIMAVPAHDERDYEFAKKYEVQIKPVIIPANPDVLHSLIPEGLPEKHTQNYKNALRILLGRMMEAPVTLKGSLVNSGEFDGMDSEEAKEAITNKVGGEITSTYRLNDWVFSRQRYWGEPIPVIHCEKCGVVPVPEDQLPVTLPEVEHYEPTGTGESPLANITDWVNTTCPKCGSAGKRETNTMPQWAGSSWYYLRFIDPHNDKTLIDPRKEKEWMPVDVYVGGDHAVRHLIYARFWHKFLYDIGAVSTIEPFTRLEFLGFILAEDGKKMSKRWGNVINPDDIVEQNGADTLRVYEMFMGPFENTVAWSATSLAGAERFLDRIYCLSERIIAVEPEESTKLLHKTIKKVGEDIEAFKFNTAISAMMIFVNAAEKDGLSNESYKIFLKLLAPFAPHLTEELWHDSEEKGSVHLQSFPAYEEALVKDDEVTIGVQINGKVRGSITLALDADEEEAVVAAKTDNTLTERFEGKEVRKIVYVPGRILSIILE